MYKAFCFSCILSFIILSTYSQQVQRIAGPPNEDWELLSDACKAIEPARQKAEQRSDEYERDVADFRNGRFCSDCKRSAGQIERELKIPYEKHIAEGGPERKSITATPEMYAQLYKQYRSDWDKLNKQYQDQVKACTEANVRMKEEQVQSRQQSAARFNSSYSDIQEKISKLAGPSSKQAAGLKQQAIEIRNQFQAELNKRPSADPRQLDQLFDKLRNIGDQVNSIANTPQPPVPKTDGVKPVAPKPPITLQLPANNVPGGSAATRQLNNTQRYIDQQNQQREQLTNTIAQGLQDMGDMIEKINRRKAEAAADQRRYEAERAQEDADFERERKQAITNRVANGLTKDVVDYGIIRLNDFNDAEFAHNCFMAGAEVNAPKAMLWLALDYLQGRGTSKNDTLAAYWLSRAADFGERTAISLLADLYRTGKLITIRADPEALLKWKMYNFYLGTLLPEDHKANIRYSLSNNGSPVYYSDTEKSAFQKLAALNSWDLYDYEYLDGKRKYEQIEEIAGLYKQRGTPEDLGIAIAWHEKYISLIQQDDHEYSKKRKLEKAADAIKELRKAGKKLPSGSGSNTEHSLFNKAFVFLIKPQMSDSAKYYLKMAAAQGDREALFILSEISIRENRLQEAAEYALEADNGIRSYRSVTVGRLIFNEALGKVKASQFTEAAGQFERASEFGGIPAILAMMQLEALYSTGNFTNPATQNTGIAPDTEKAQYWMEKCKRLREEEKLMQFRK